MREREKERGTGRKKRDRLSYYTKGPFTLQPGPDPRYARAGHRHVNSHLLSGPFLSTPDSSEISSHQLDIASTSFVKGVLERVSYKGFIKECKTGIACW